MREMTKRERYVYRFLIAMTNNKFQIIIYSVGSVHILLFLLFLYLQVTALYIFNVFSVVTYAFCAYMVQRHQEKLLSVFYVTYLEILLHSFVASLCVGWQYGFMMYIIARVSFCFHMCYNLIEGRKRYVVAFILSLFAFLTFICCRLIIMIKEPFYTTEISPIFECVIYVFNSICTFVFIIGITLIYVVEIQMSTNKLNMQNALLEKMANTDPLTGLYNRRSIQVFLDHAVESDSEFCIIMCDIDDFKKVNDTYGHDFGDVVLKDIAGIIRHFIEGYGYVCRWGGEEILILSNQNLEQTKITAEKIRRNIANHLFSCKDKLIHCSITIGIASHKQGKTLDETIELADYNLYCGKRNGKNKVVA